MLAQELLTSCSGPWVLRSDGPSTFLELGNTVILDGRKMMSLDNLYDEIAENFSFPEYFGRNFNSLSEMLSDLSWLNKNAYIVLVKDANKVLADEQTGALSGFLELLSDVGEEWSEPIEHGQDRDRPCVPFHSILQVDSSDGSNGFSQLPRIQCASASGAPPTVA